MRIAAFALAALATACVSAPDTTPINQVLTAPPPAPVEIELGVNGDAIALALSGGGARAASFSLGALLQLRDMKGADGRALIDKVALVTSVSGGSTIAAYFGLHGASGLDRFRADMLDKDWQSQLHTTFVSPENWQRLMQGGVNGPDKLGDWLENEVYSGAHMKDLSSHPAAHHHHRSRPLQWHPLRVCRALLPGDLQRPWFSPHRGCGCRLYVGAGCVPTDHRKAA